MKRETLKEKLFRVFGKDLAAAGATKTNTKVQLNNKPKTWGRQTFIYLGKLRRRFVALVPKVAGAAFVIWVSIVPLIPSSTPILVPQDHKPAITTQAAQALPHYDFPKFPLSESLQLYVTQYGIRLPASTPTPDATYDIQPGTHLIVVPHRFTPPPSYVRVISGSLLR